MDAKGYLAAYYKDYDENGRLASKHGMVEFLTTMRYVRRYLKPGDRVMEIGAGPGRYSHALAREGYAVDAVELIESSIEVFMANTEPGENVTVTQGTAVDLAGFGDGVYDVTLLLGPMYHLFTVEDKRAALREAIRVTKTGGVVFAAYCVSDPSILDYGFQDGHIFELIEKGMVNTETFKAYSHPWDLFELHRREDIDELMEGFGVSRLHYVATDGFTNHMQRTVDAMDDATFDLYVKYHFAICERTDMSGLSHHVLDVFRKHS